MTKKKLIAIVVAAALVVCCAITGTLAWLTATSPKVTNTFTFGNIDITLTEDEGGDGHDQFKMIPGWTIDKDPVVTVEGGSEDCWLFVKVDESTTPALTDYITYIVGGKSVTDDTTTSVVEGGWEQGNGTDIPANVYYREVSASTNDQAFSVIGYMNGSTFIADKVLVKDTVTKAMMDALTDATQPTLSFTAYATQLYKNNTEKFEAAEAWAKVNP